MEKWVRQMTQDCVCCSHKNNSIWKASISPLRPIPVEPKAFWRIHVDLMGPFQETPAGNKYVGVAVCPLLKYPEAKRKHF